MNDLVKAKNLFKLSQLLETILLKNFQLYYNGKALKFNVKTKILLSLSVFFEDTPSHVEIICYINKKKICRNKNINEKSFIIHQIIDCEQNDVLTIKNNCNIPIKMDNIKLNIFIM